MDHRKGRLPATRSDVGRVGHSVLARMDRLGDRLEARIDGVEKRLDAKIDGVEKRLDAKIDGVEKRLDAKIDGVDKRLDRVEKTGLSTAAAVVRLQSDVRSLSDRFDSAIPKLPTLDQLQAMMDKYFKEQEMINRSRELRADLWRDHERRISALEVKAGGAQAG